MLLLDIDLVGCTALVGSAALAAALAGGFRFATELTVNDRCGTAFTFICFSVFIKNPKSSAPPLIII